MEFLFHMDFVLGHEEVNFIKTNWNIDKSKVSLGLGICIKSGLWININWGTLLFHCEEIDLIESDWDVNETKVSLGLGVCTTVTATRTELQSWVARTPLALATRTTFSSREPGTCKSMIHWAMRRSDFKLANAQIAQADHSNLVVTMVDNTHSIANDRPSVRGNKQLTLLYPSSC